MTCDPIDRDPELSDQITNDNVHNVNKHHDGSGICRKNAGKKNKIR